MRVTDISESLTDAVPYRVGRGLRGNFLNTFAINGTTYYVDLSRVNRKDDWWRLTLSTKKSRSIEGDPQPTGEGNAFQVFATVKKIISVFLEENRPDYFIFGTKNSNLTGVYQKMFKRFAPEAQALGYHPGEQEIEGARTFFYTSDSAINIRNDKARPHVGAK